ncbi:uncharacterized protein DUF3617 [Nitrosomonas nitrosa]|jgi:hypothetical protein|uniref:DUF3617 domain-containing protein n=1 Tax=Nitrosomonas nitrosa TaxID=52442 RepID=A0A1I4UKF7_9PROT|nr:MULTISPECIES: DUF3617 domain-containing protein [Nitrosomonas]MCO6434622.1 DUF3617 domain-containing protein [Nitrosomonas nitrosa]MCW5602356.1 DUF3617 domain-containing protein [Nitrosomonas sp.]PTQ93935.1 uncharacterized protein DUF3617 [Nitrosomonas nitrosa]CAE6489343.1 conserved exported hypothetical protein [Nitrosomonas nitrosa]SFM89220.1 Protein of unknown function [Nitrosomonas nitrosa]
MRKNVFFFLLLGVLSATCWAENIVRPGLWEVKTRSDLLALVPHIPAEQMEQLNRLVKQYGLEMPQIHNGAATSQVCITPEMAKQDVPTYFYDNQSGCTVKDAARTGNRYQIALTCDNPQFKGNGYAEGTFTNPESFTGRTEFDGVVQGAPINSHADTIGQWVSERCELAQPFR